jgi:hypothetical protein
MCPSAQPRTPNAKHDASALVQWSEQLPRERRGGGGLGAAEVSERFALRSRVDAGRPDPAERFADVGRTVGAVAAATMSLWLPPPYGAPVHRGRLVAHCMVRTEEHATEPRAGRSSSSLHRGLNNYACFPNRVKPSTLPPAEP